MSLVQTTPEFLAQEACGKLALFEDDHPPRGMKMVGSYMVEVNSASDCFTCVIFSVPVGGFGLSEVLTYLTMTDI